MANPGRPSKLTPALIKEFETLLSVVPYWETAADYLELPAVTVYRWMKRGEREPGTLYGEFCRVTKKARARHEISLAREVRQQPLNWQRFAWMLERAFPDHWGKRTEITFRKEAAWVAQEYGLDEKTVLAEVERALAETR